MPSDLPIDLVWRKSSRSNGDGNVCVEVTVLTARAAVRDSKNPQPTLVIPAMGWRALLHVLAAGT